MVWFESYKHKSYTLFKSQQAVLFEEHVGFLQLGKKPIKTTA